MGFRSRSQARAATNSSNPRVRRAESSKAAEYAEASRWADERWVEVAEEAPVTKDRKS